MLKIEKKNNKYFKKCFRQNMLVCRETLRLKSLIIIAIQKQVNTNCK